MSNLLRFAWILGIAIFLPISLPAGGASRAIPQIRRREKEDPILSISGCFLKSSPLKVAPCIRTLEVGTPMKILHSWESPEGDNWIHVRITETGNNLLLGSVSHGWLNA